MVIRCVILGGGGHTHVLLDCLSAAGNVEVLGILDRDSTKWGTDIYGVPVLGGDELLDGLHNRGVTHFVVGVGSARNTAPRAKMYRLGQLRRLLPLTIVHPSAICSRRAVVGDGGQLLPGSIVNTGAVLGKNVLVNSGAIVEHDCRIGDHVHIATGARLAGNVVVEDMAHIGVGAVIRQGITIGENAVVGAGAVVVKDVLPSTVVVGVPARVMVNKAA